jgi:DNA mismatch repair ATPase MutS
MKVRINKNMCFTEFIEKDTTYLYMENSSHLLIDNPVVNTITLNSENCVITGPNAAGKSTFIKSTSLNILLSQTMGISCSSVCKITPFYYINTQINIPDSKGVESLFEAEMFRCKYNIDIVKELPTNYKSYIVFDEIFSSTNIIEGISGAYAILDKLSKYKNTLIIITTHYLYLTKLTNFKKIKFIADIIDSQQSDIIDSQQSDIIDSQQSDIIDSQQSDIIDSQQSDIIDSQQNNIITYNYKIQNGISKQFIALDILKSKFLDDLDIIEKAMSIKNKLLV